MSEILRRVGQLLFGFGLLMSPASGAGAPGSLPGDRTEAQAAA